MKLKLTEDADKQPSTARTGIAGRVEAASKAAIPPPKGKGLVMMLIGVAVLAAVIYDFTGRSAPAQSVEKIARESARRRAEEDPPTAPDGPAGALELSLAAEAGGPSELTLPYAAAVVYYTTAPAETQRTLRPKFLKAVAAVEDLRGRRGREAFELATRLIEGAGPESDGPITDLSVKALKALEDNTAAPAAIAFIAALEDGVGKLTARALDNVILDPLRPIHIRAAAARARPTEGRPETVSRLATDAKTHPTLRAALR